MTLTMIVAIDGPSGAGKGTVARTVARALGFRHVDTGAMYRGVAWKALETGADLADGAALARLAAAATFDLADRVVVDGVDITEAIRTPAIDEAAAAVARQPAVRAVLVERQRALAPGPDEAGGGLVMEGRDIGTVVFPGADVKIYLDADPGERARRRAADPAHAHGRAGPHADVSGVARALEARDVSDRTRAVSPLTLAPGALYLDTTTLSIERVVGRVLEAIRDVRTGR
jgi:cytidylate kinase